MHPIQRIAMQELRSLLRNRALWAAWTACAVLLGFSVLIRIPAYLEAERWKAETARVVRGQWVTQGSRHPHSAAHYGIYAFRPLGPTAVLDPGISEFIGQTLPLETHQRHFAIHPPVDDATAARRMAGLSPSLIALSLIPLLLILFGYGLVSKERETGTLAQLLATGIGSGQILWGKAAALAVLGTGLVVTKLLMEAAALVWIGGSVDVARFAGLEVLQWFHAMVWVFLILSISARARASHAALALLLMAWVANGFLLPRVAGSAGRLAAPEPSVEEFRAAMQHDISFREDGKRWVDDWSKSLIAETLKRYGVQRIEDLPVGYAGIMLKSSDAHYERVFEKHFARLHQIHRRQELWHHVLSWMGPMLAARSLGQGLAGTDLAHAVHFADEAERYRRMFVEATNDAIEKGTRGSGWSLRMNRAYWESIPAFRYEMPGAVWAMRQHLFSMAILGIWLIGSVSLFLRGRSWIARFPR